MEHKSIVCIVCPMGCQMEVLAKVNGIAKYTVAGNKCPRGEVYGIKEITNPTRVLTSTVKIKNAPLSRLPVKTNGSISKEKIFECVQQLNDVEVEAPIKIGDIIIKNISGTEIDIVATRSM